MALTTYSHAVWVFEFWSPIDHMMIGKILYEDLVHVDLFYDDASQNLLRVCCRFETIFCSVHVCGVESHGVQLNHHGHAEEVEAFPTIGLCHCEIQLVAHPF